MTSFDGFGSDKPIIVPETFFSDLLPLLDDLAELKLVLFCMWALQQREGHYRYLTDDDLSNPALRDSLHAARPDAPPDATRTDALARAVERGVLLSTQIPRPDSAPLTVYLMNTVRGREALAAIEQGSVPLRDGAAHRVEILPPRPNVYRLYEQEIGALTPMIAEGLRDLEKAYPAGWLPDAVRVAAEQQAKNLNYIRAVLERWRRDGRKGDDEITGRHGSVGDAGDGRRFITGKYADFIDH